MKTEQAVKNLFVASMLLVLSSDALADLSFSGDQRIRFESIRNNFRAASSLSDDLLLSRTQLRLENAFSKQYSVLVEVTDSRQWLADSDTRLNSGMVNTLELTQARVRLTSDGTQVDFGKMTVEDSSRRLLARNQFRNSANTFLGVDAQHVSGQDRWRGFFLWPNDASQTRAELRDNRSSTDQFHSQTWIAGLSWQGELAEREVEVAAYHFQETDSRDRATRNRQLSSLSAQYTGQRSSSGWQFSNHTVLQWGHSRASSNPDDRDDLDVTALFQHASWSRELTHAWLRRWSINFDYASGDGSASDQEIGAFDSLFGVTRFEWGPGSLYGALNRSNVISGALRVDVRRDDFSGYVAYRPVWVAQTSGTWGRSGERAAAGRFIGHQLDFRARLQQGRHVQWELGGAYLHRGSMPRASGVGSERGHPVYGYLQVQFSWNPAS